MQVKSVPAGDSGILSFDDLFSLFFGTMMAADLHDLFDLATFINKYLQKQLYKISHLRKKPI